MNRRAQRGFTLIELTLVLFVLALSAHLAVRELSRQRAARLRTAADAQLDAMAAAVWDGASASGFLSMTIIWPLRWRTSAKRGFPPPFI